jgi:hypothetical protein
MEWGIEVQGISNENTTLALFSKTELADMLRYAKLGLKRFVRPLAQDVSSSLILYGRRKIK